MKRKKKDPLFDTISVTGHFFPKRSAWWYNPISLLVLCHTMLIFEKEWGINNFKSLKYLKNKHACLTY